MPSSSLCFRASCGSFYWSFLNFMRKRARKKAALRLRVVCVNGPVAVALVFLVAFLLQCGDVEPNPGPPPPKATKQSTLTEQSSCRDSRSPGGGTKGNYASDADPTIADVVSMLNKLDRKIDSMHASVQEQMDKIQSDITDVMKENQELKEKVDRLESKLDDVEGRSRRKNLIFYGIPRRAGGTETWEDCENAVKSVLREKLGMDDVDIERAHRLRGGKVHNPIIASFEKYKDKESILSGCRKHKDKRPEVFVTEDFTPRVREKRRKLLPFLKEAKQAQKRAFLRFDTLVIEGKVYVYDSVTGKLQERHAVS